MRIADCRPTRCIAIVLLSCIVGCDQTYDQPPATSREQAWFQLHDRYEISFPFTSDGPGISDAALGSAGEIVVLRSRQIEVYDTTGQLRFRESLPHEYQALDKFGWKSRASDNRYYIVNAAVSTILEYSRSSGWSTLSPRVLNSVHDIAVLDGGRTLVVAGVDTFKRATLETISLDRSRHQVLDSLPLLWDSGFSLQSDSFGNVVIARAFPRTIHLASADMPASEYLVSEEWRDDAIHARRGSVDFAIGQANERGAVIFGGMVDSLLVTIESRPHSERRLRVINLQNGQRRALELRRAFNIIDFAPASCRSVTLDWLNDAEVARVVELVSASGRCGSGDRQIPKEAT